MKFVRHLSASLALVATIVGLGVLWSHSSLASLVTEGHDRFPPGANAGATANNPVNDRFDRGRDGGGGTLTDRAMDLAQTTGTEAAVIGGIVFLDKKRRKHSSRLSLGR